MSLSAIRAVFMRDLRSYVLSPLAWVTVAVFAFVNGLTFISVLTVLSHQGAGLSEPLVFLFGDSLFFWLFLLYLTPALTMRTFSEEEDSGTLELLLTAPVREVDLVLGKFLASFAVYGLVWSSSLLFPIVLSGYGDLDWGPVAASYIGVFGMGALFLSAGTLSSCLSRSQLVAALLTFGIVLTLFLVGLLEDLVRAPGLREALSYTSLWRHMADFARGVVDTRPIVYYLTGTGLFLFLATRVLANKRWR